MWLLCNDGVCVNWLNNCIINEFKPGKKYIIKYSHGPIKTHLYGLNHL